MIEQTHIQFYSLLNPTKKIRKCTLNKYEPKGLGKQQRKNNTIWVARKQMESGTDLVYLRKLNFKSAVGTVKDELFILQNPLKFQEFVRHGTFSLCSCQTTPIHFSRRPEVYCLEGIIQQNSALADTRYLLSKEYFTESRMLRCQLLSTHLALRTLEVRPLSSRNDIERASSGENGHTQ